MLRALLGRFSAYSERQIAMLFVCRLCWRCVWVFGMGRDKDLGYTPLWNENGFGLCIIWVGISRE
jgi:hypothetical protein